MIIGLCGKTKSGKSTCAEYLVKNYGFKELTFADSMKQAVLDRLHNDQYDPDQKKVKEDNNILIRGLERQLFQESKTFTRFVISDCRRIPEWKFLLKLGARTVRINRPSEIKIETELDDLMIYTPDHLLINDSKSLESFYAKLDLLCEHLGISAINENNNKL